MRLSGALQKKRTSEISYREIVKNSSNDDTTAAKQVLVISAIDLRFIWSGDVCFKCWSFELSVYQRIPPKNVSKFQQKY